MTNHAPALTIRRTIERPPASLIASFREVPTCFIADAQGGRGCLHYSVKPLDPQMRVCGPAVTASCGAMDNLAAMVVTEFAEPGDVIVIACNGHRGAAVVGDLWALSAKRLGIAGVVCDGLVRDVAGILAADLPLFTHGWCPNAYTRKGPGEINLGVDCGGVRVEPGDLVVGDRDGVAVVPREEIPRVLEQLAQVRKKEDRAQASLRQGETLRFWDRAAFADQGLIRYLD